VPDQCEAGFVKEYTRLQVRQTLASMTG
jgi:hypothetical protein